MSLGKLFDIAYGIFLVLMCDIGYWVTVWLLTAIMSSTIVRWFQDDYGPLGVFVVAILATGLVQLLYAIPLYRRYKRVGRPEVSTGIMVMAGFTLFLSASGFFSIIFQF